MEHAEILSRRLANQQLTEPHAASPAEVVAALGAVQAQDYAGAKWALAQRIRGGSNDAALDTALAEGTILRTHLLRPTWHFVTPKDIRWLLDLTAPRVHAANAFMYRRMGLDAGVFKQSARVLRQTLRGGKQKTRAELAAALEKAGIVTKDGVRLGLLMMHAELDGVVCSSARMGKQFTYALLEERAPQSVSLTRADALAELTRRYFSTRGPATAQDYQWWSGLTLADARLGIEMVKTEFMHEEMGGRTYWFPANAPAPKPKAPSVYLLPNYDEYFIGLRDRTAFAQGAKTLRMEQGSVALNAHIVVLDGQIVGGWRRVPEGGKLIVELDLLTTLSAKEKTALERAAGRFAAFAGKPVETRPGGPRAARGWSFV
jgi:hypothetical protein